MENKLLRQHIVIFSFDLESPSCILTNLTVTNFQGKENFSQNFAMVFRAFPGKIAPTLIESDGNENRIDRRRVIDNLIDEKLERERVSCQRFVINYWLIVDRRAAWLIN